MQIEITQELDGLCVRDVLRRYLSLSTKMLKYLKYRNDGILVNGTHCTVRYVLRRGDVLSVNTYVQSGFEAIGNSITDSIVGATQGAVNAVTASVADGLTELGNIGYNEIVKPAAEAMEAVYTMIGEYLSSIFNYF